MRTGSCSRLRSAGSAKRPSGSGSTRPSPVSPSSARSSWARVGPGRVEVGPVHRADGPAQHRQQPAPHCRSVPSYFWVRRLAPPPAPSGGGRAARGQPGAVAGHWAAVAARARRGAQRRRPAPSPPPKPPATRARRGAATGAAAPPQAAEAAGPGDQAAQPPAGPAPAAVSVEQACRWPKASWPPPRRCRALPSSVRSGSRRGRRVAGPQDQFASRAAGAHGGRACPLPDSSATDKQQTSPQISHLRRAAQVSGGAAGHQRLPA